MKKLTPILILILLMIAGGAVVYEELNYHDVTVDIIGSGTVDGDGKYRNGETAELSAEGSSGYHFDHWEIGGKSVSSENRYNITSEKNTRVTAVFERNTYIVTISLENPEAGTFSGGGSYLYQDIAELSASACPGYVFDGWYVDGILLNGGNEYGMPVTGNTFVTALFSIDHDATFDVGPADPVINIPIECEPAYNIGISEQIWTIKDANSGDEILPRISDKDCEGGRAIFELSEPANIKVTRMVEYVDGGAATFSRTFIVDNTFTREYTWGFMHGNSWALETISADFSFSEYHRQVHTIEPKTPTCGDFDTPFRMGDLPDMITYWDPLVIDIAESINMVTSGLSDLQRAQALHSTT